MKKTLFAILKLLVAISCFWIVYELLFHIIAVMSLNKPDPTSVLLPIEVDGKWGYVDKTGKIAIQPNFMGAGYFSEGLAPVCVNVIGKGEENESLWGFIDKTGKVVIEPKFIDASSFHEVLAAVAITDKDGKNNKLWGYINKGGRFVIKPQYSVATNFENDVAIVLLGEAYETERLIDITGKTIFEGDSSRIDGFSEGLAFVQAKDRNGVNDPWGIIDRTGKFVVKPMFYNVGRFHNGLAPVCTSPDSDYGFIDKKGKMVIPARFTNARDFSEGLAYVQPAGQELCGYIDTAGKTVIKPQFVWAKSFSEGLALADDGKKLFGFIDKTGKMVVPLDSSEIEDAGEFQNGVVVVGNEAYFGCMNLAGKIIVPIQYSGINRMDDGIIKVYDDEGGFGYFNGDGDCIWKRHR